MKAVKEKNEAAESPKTYKVKDQYKTLHVIVAKVYNGPLGNANEEQVAKIYADHKRFQKYFEVA